MDRQESPNSRRTPPPDRARLARLYPVLAQIPRPLAESLRERGRNVRAASGAIAFEEDSPCRGLTLLTHGSIRVSRVSAEGREILLYRVRPGESCILSIACLLGGATYEARGTVEGELAGIVVPRDLFETLVSDVTPFRSYIFELIGARIAGLMQLVEEVAFHRLDRRLASILLERFRESGRATLCVTHQELASQIGSVREMVSRVLESFESRGAIRLGRGQVELRLTDVLEEEAGPALPPVTRSDLAAR